MQVATDRNIGLREGDHGLDARLVLLAGVVERDLRRNAERAPRLAGPHLGRVQDRRHRLVHLAGRNRRAAVETQGLSVFFWGGRGGGGTRNTYGHNKRWNEYHNRRRNPKIK